MDDTGISVFLFVLWIPFQHSINGMTPLLELLLQTDDDTHSNLYTEQPSCAHALTQRGLCREKLLHTFLRLLVRLPDPLPFFFPFPSLLCHLVSLNGDSSCSQ